VHRLRDEVEDLARRLEETDLPRGDVLDAAVEAASLDVCIGAELEDEGAVRG
jgi:hypothetical protein